MNRIFIKVLRTNGEVDYYRFEPKNLSDNHYDRAFSFLRDIILTNETTKEWYMMTKTIISIDEYHVIED